MLLKALVLIPLAAACATEGAGSVIPSTATGQLEPWRTAPPLPVPRANHCSAVIDDWVLVIGGNYKQGAEFVKTADIHAAQLAPDGTLGAWQLAGQAPSPVTECNATSDGRSLYLIDGLYDDELSGRQVFTAELDANGHLAPLTSLGRLPADQIAISSEATVRAGNLVLMDTRLQNEGDTVVTLRTPLSAPLAWTVDDWAIGFRGQAQYAFADHFTYVLGGYKGDTGNPVSTDTFVMGDGAPRATTPLPTPTTFGEAVAVDDWVFVVGGRTQVFGATGSASVLASPIDATGNLGAWTSTAELPMIRTNHDLALVGDHLVLTGGAGAGPGDTTVLTARVRYPVE